MWKRLCFIFWLMTPFLALADPTFLQQPVEELRIGTGWFGSKSYIEQRDEEGEWCRNGYVDFVHEEDMPLTFYLYDSEGIPQLMMELDHGLSTKKQFHFVISDMQSVPQALFEAKAYYFTNTVIEYELRSLNDDILLSGAFSRWSWCMEDGYPVGVGFKQQMVNVAQCAFALGTQKLNIEEIDTKYFAAHPGLWQQYLLIKGATFNPKYFVRAVWRHL